MKRFGFAGLMLVALLFAAQVASAEDWPGCPWGSAYDPISNGYVPACFNRPAAAESVAPKPVGLAQAAPVHSAVQGWPGCPYGYDHDPKCQSGPAAAPDTVSKPAGLAQPAPAEKFVPCGFGERLDPLALACQQLSSPVDAAAKPAGLAAPAPAEKFVPCGFGERLDPLALACRP